MTEVSKQLCKFVINAIKESRHTDVDLYYSILVRSIHDNQIDSESKEVKEAMEMVSGYLLEKSKWPELRLKA